MVRFKYVHWCISHQQYVAPKAWRKLRDQPRCKIVRLNLTFLKQIDLHRLLTWINSNHSSDTVPSVISNPWTTSPRSQRR